MSVPLMSLVIPPPQAAAIMLPLLVFMDLFGIWAYRGKWDKPNLKILLPASLIGVILGTATFRYLDISAFRLLIGLIAVSFALNAWFNWSQRERPPATRSWRRGGFWGAVAGFVSFVAHAGGPPVSVYLLPQRLDKTVFQATTVVFFTTTNLIKLVPYTLLGQFNTENLTTSLMLAPLVPVAMVLAIYMHTRVSDRLFYRVCYVLLFLTGCKLLYDGFTALMI